jgi:hypothetical protein
LFHLGLPSSDAFYFLCLLWALTMALSIPRNCLCHWLTTTISKPTPSLRNAVICNFYPTKE